MQQIVDANPAEKLAQDLIELLLGRDSAHIAVSGGSTPRQLFRILAERYRDSVNWDRVTVWQVDERCVSPEDPQSNWRMLHEELLINIPGIQARRMQAELTECAMEYEALIRAQIPPGPEGIPRLDLILLGMGGDGHTASLFPGTAALEEQRKLIVKNNVPQLGVDRVTMTYPLINTAKERWFLVAGADKAEAYARVQRGSLPASRIHNPRWYIDPHVACAR